MSNLTRINIDSVKEIGVDATNSAYLKRVDIVEVVDKHGNPWEPVLPSDPLEVADGQGANWVGSNVYEIGQTVEARTAAFTGGVEPITYRYRFQTKAVGADTWVNEAWTNTTNAKNAIFRILADPGQIKFQTQARDSSDPTVQVNSITGVKTVTGDPFIEGGDPPPITRLTLPEWDVNNVYKPGETISCTTATFEGGLPPYNTCSWKWQYRLKGGARMQDSFEAANVTEAIEYGNKVITVSGVVPQSLAEIRLWCAAGDDLDGDPEVDSLTYKNAFSSIQQIQTTIGTVAVSPDSTAVAVMGSKTFTAVVTGGDATDLTYKWNVRSGNAQIDTPDNQATVTYTFIGAGQTQIQCTVYSANSSNSPLSNLAMVIVS